MAPKNKFTKEAMADAALREVRGQVLQAMERELREEAEKEEEADGHLQG